MKGLLILPRNWHKLTFSRAIYSHRSEVHNEPRRKGQSNLMFQRHLQNAKGEEKYSKMLPLTQKRRLKRRCNFFSYCTCVLHYQQKKGLEWFTEIAHFLLTSDFRISDFDHHFSIEYQRSLNIMMLWRYLWIHKNSRTCSQITVFLGLKLYNRKFC